MPNETHDGTTFIIQIQEIRPWLGMLMAWLEVGDTSRFGYPKA